MAHPTREPSTLNPKPENGSRRHVQLLDLLVGVLVNLAGSLSPFRTSALLCGVASRSLWLSPSFLPMGYGRKEPGMTVLGSVCSESVSLLGTNTAAPLSLSLSLSPLSPFLDLRYHSRSTSLQQYGAN